MNIDFDEAIVRWHGQKERVAVLLAGAARIPLSLADTARCAVDLDSARRTLKNLLGERLAGLSEGSEVALQAHCRKLTKWKEPKPRY